MKEVIIKLYSIDELHPNVLKMVIAKHQLNIMDIEDEDYFDKCMDKARFSAGTILKTVSLRYCDELASDDTPRMIISGNIDIRRAISVSNLKIKESIIKAIERNYTFHIASSDTTMLISRDNKHPRLSKIINDIRIVCYSELEDIINDTLEELDKPCKDIMDKIRENKWLYRENGEQYHALSGDKEVK